MLRLLKGNHEYLISEDALEDWVVRAFDSCLGFDHHGINFSGRNLLVPYIAGASFESTLGSEADTLDDWPAFDIKMYSSLKTLKQHFVVFRNAVVRRADSTVTGLVAVYLQRGVDPCGCIYCREGLAGLMASMETKLEGRGVDSCPLS